MTGQLLIHGRGSPKIARHMGTYLSADPPVGRWSHPCSWGIEENPRMKQNLRIAKVPSRRLSAVRRRPAISE